MTTTKPTLMDEWSTLPCKWNVFKLQQRIYRASNRGDCHDRKTAEERPQVRMTIAR